MYKEVQVPREDTTAGMQSSQCRINQRFFKTGTRARLVYGSRYRMIARPGLDDARLLIASVTEILPAEPVSGYLTITIKSTAYELY